MAFSELLLCWVVYVSETRWDSFLFHYSATWWKGPVPPIRAESVLMALTKGWPEPTEPDWSTAERKQKENGEEGGNKESTCGWSQRNWNVNWHQINRSEKRPKGKIKSSSFTGNNASALVNHDKLDESESRRQLSQRRLAPPTWSGLIKALITLSLDLNKQTREDTVYD